MGPALSLLALAALNTSVEVRASGPDRLDIRASAAPLADVLERLSKQTGMRVVYEGTPQRQPVTLSLDARTPAEAVLGVLEGMGLNYAVLMDLSGSRVETLMVTGSVSASGASPSQPPLAPPPQPFQRPIAAPVPPPQPEPEAAEEDNSTEEENADGGEAQEQKDASPAAEKPETTPPQALPAAPVGLPVFGTNPFPPRPAQAPAPQAPNNTKPSPPPPGQEQQKP